MAAQLNCWIFARIPRYIAVGKKLLNLQSTVKSLKIHLIRMLSQFCRQILKNRVRSKYNISILFIPKYFTSADPNEYPLLFSIYNIDLNYLTADIFDTF